MWELALPAAQMIYGGFQSLKANKELKKLANQDISYQSTPETKQLLGVTRDNAMHGYSAAEKAAFLQNVAANGAKAYRLGMSRAGNSLSNAIGASNQISNSQAMNQFAANDAQQQRQNQNIYAGMVAQDQNRANMNTQLEANNNRMAQQAFGQAQKQGVENIFSGMQMGTMVGEDNNWGKGTPNLPPNLPQNSGTPQLNYANDISMYPNKQQYGQNWQANPYNVQAPQINPIWHPFYGGNLYQNMSTPPINNGQSWGGQWNAQPYKY